MLPCTLKQPGGLGATLADDPARDAFLVQQMHALAVSIYQARQRNDRAGVQNLLEVFKKLADEYQSRGGDITGTDRFVLAVGDWVENSIDAIPSAIAALPKAIGFGLLGAAVPFVLIFAGYVVLRNWERK